MTNEYLNNRWDKRNHYNYGVELAQGRIPQKFQINKFGKIAKLKTDDLNAPIWDLKIPYTFQAGNVEHFISSSSIADNQFISVTGLDGNYDWKTIRVQLNGQVQTSIGFWTRTFRAFNDDSTNMLGDVYIYENSTVTEGIPDDITQVRAYIDEFEHQTTMAIFTVPRNYTAIVTDIIPSCAFKNDSFNLFRLRIREFGKVFRSTLTFSVSSMGTSCPVITPDLKWVFPEKTDILLDAATNKSDTYVSGAFHMILERND